MDQSLKELAVKLSALRTIDLCDSRPIKVLDCLCLIYSHLIKKNIGQAMLMKLLQTEGIKQLVDLLSYQTE